MDTTRTGVRLTRLFLLLGTLANAGYAAPLNPASLQVTILDENGSLVHSAHIYIFSEDKKEFFGTRDAYGTTTFDLPAGQYRLYAAMVLKTDGIVDHYASPEAKISITTEEPTSVILALQRAENKEMVLSDTARQKMNISEDLANNLN
jgi:hypothetical protein